MMDGTKNLSLRTVPVSLIFTWHVDPVHGSIALAAHIAHIHVIGPDVVCEVGLPVHEGVTANVPRSGGQVDPASAMKTKAIVKLVYVVGTICNNVNIAITDRIKDLLKLS